MLLTVGIIKVLSHVSTLVTGGDPALYLNKMLQSTEVVRPLVGESSTSVAQQQQFKMLLGGGGEAGGIASPIAPRGSSGVSEENQLPRASKQNMTKPEDQFSAPSVAQQSSKRQRSALGFEADDMSSEAPKKARSSVTQDDQRKMEKEEEEKQDHLLQSGKSHRSRASSEASAPHGHISSGGKGKISSKEGLQEVQEIPSFDDLLTQAIDAVNRPLSLASTAASSLMSSVAPLASGPAAGSAPSPSAIPAPPPMPTWTTPSARGSAPSATPAPSAPAPTVTSPSTPSVSVPAASPPPPPAMPTWTTPSARGTALSAAPVPSATAPTVTPPAPLAIGSTPMLTEEQLNAHIQLLQGEHNTLLGEMTAKMSNLSLNYDPSDDSDKLFAIEKEISSLQQKLVGMRQPSATPAPSAPAPTVTSPTPTPSPSPSVSAPAASPPAPPPMPTWTTPASSASAPAASPPPAPALPTWPTRTPSATGSPSSTSAPSSSAPVVTPASSPTPSTVTEPVDPTLQPVSVSATATDASTAAAPVSSPERQSLLADIQKGATLKKAAPVQKRSTPQDEIKKSQFALKPTPEKEAKKPQPTPEPQEPAGMKKSDLGKKSESARAGEELLSQALHTLEVKKEKLIKEEEWQRANNPKFRSSHYSKELTEIEGTISQIKSQMQAESKSSDSALADVENDTSKKTITSTPPRVDLLSGITAGVKLRKAPEKTNEGITKEPKEMDSGTAAVLARRASIADDDYDTDSDDSWLEGGFPVKSAPVQPVSVQPKKEEVPTGLKGKFMSFGKGLKDTGKKLKDKIANKLTGKKSDNKEAKDLAPSAVPSAPPPVIETDVVAPVASPPAPPPLPDLLPVQPVKKPVSAKFAKLGGNVSEDGKNDLFAAIQKGSQLTSVPELQKKKDPTTDLLASIVKGSKLKHVAPPQVQSQPQKKPEDALSKAFSSVTDFFSSKLNTSEDFDAEAKKKLPLSGGSDSGSDSDDDWD